MAQKLLIPATSTSANAVVPFSRSPSRHITNWSWNIFYKGEKKPFSDHPHALKAPPEPYGKGSSAPAINTDGKAARPPCSPCDKQHMDVGTFQQSLRESQDPRQRQAQLPARPQERAVLPRAGLTAVLSEEEGQHPRHGTSGTAAPAALQAPGASAASPGPPCPPGPALHSKHQIPMTAAH